MILLKSSEAAHTPQRHKKNERVSFFACLTVQNYVEIFIFELRKAERAGERKRKEECSNNGAKLWHDIIFKVPANKVLAFLLCFLLVLTF